MERAYVGDLVAGCSVLAALLEVSAYPKPGNVHRTRDLPGTRYEHFLAGGVAMGSSMRSLAQAGHDVRSGSKGWGDLRLGEHVREAVEETLAWQRGGNVNLGIILLFSPLAAAAGYSLGDNGLEVGELRDALRRVTMSTTPGDAVGVYEAIRLAVSSEVLGRVDELDVMDDSALQRIQRDGITLMEVFRKCSLRDSICKEWVSDFEATFTIGYPYLREALKATDDINSAVVDTFLRILSDRSDSLIQRKSGPDRALEVSEKAGLILREGGSSSERGRELLWALDQELHEAGGMLNPGTTADLTAASLFVLLLEGWRP